MKSDPTHVVGQHDPRMDSLLAWFFVLVWGSGYLATRTGMQYAAPFTFLTLRFALGVLCMIPLVLWFRPSWPRSGRELFHLCVAGLLMHAINLGGSHYTQYLGMSAGNTALILALQPLLTAVFAQRRLAEKLSAVHWLGVCMGLGGVVLVVWPKLSVNATAAGSLVAVSISLVAITAGTLYQRVYCATIDLRSGALIQLLVSMLFMAPLAWGVEGFIINWHWHFVLAISFLVVFGSILAVSALHLLMRRGQATRVTSLFFLTPIVTVVLEWMLFGVFPSWLTSAGIAITCTGVALVSRPQRVPGQFAMSAQK